MFYCKNCKKIINENTCECGFNAYDLHLNEHEWKQMDPFEQENAVKDIIKEESLSFEINKLIDNVDDVRYFSKGIFIILATSIICSIIAAIIVALVI